MPNISTSALAPIPATAGLSVRILPGTVYVGSSIVIVPFSSVIVAQNKTNFIFFNTNSSSLQVNQTGFPLTACFPIATATTDPFNVTSVIDNRVDFYLSGGGGSVSVNYTNIKTSTTTTIKSGSGTLAQIQINNPGSGWSMTIYDNTSGSGTTIGTTTSLSGLSGITLVYTTLFNTGLTIVTTGATPGDITVSWS